jgi:hypothetical protein
VTFISFITNRNAFDIRVRDSVPIQPVGNEGLVLATDATSRSANASLVQVISGVFWFNFTSHRTCLSTPANFCNELISM